MKEPLMRMWNLSVTIDPKEHGLMPIDSHESAIKAEREHRAKVESRAVEIADRITILESCARITAAEIEVCKCADALIENLDRTKFDGYTPEGRLMRAAVYAMREAQGRIPAKPIEQWLVVDGDFHHLHDSEESATKHAKERGGLRVVHLREVNDAEAAR